MECQCIFRTNCRRSAPCIKAKRGNLRPFEAGFLSAFNKSRRVIGKDKPQRYGRLHSRQIDNADIANFQFPRDIRGRRRPQPPIADLQRNPVIANQLRPAIQQHQCQAGLAASRQPFDQYAPAADGNASGLVHSMFAFHRLHSRRCHWRCHRRCHRRYRPSSGSCSTRQAPSLPSFLPCAMSEPSCASAIVLAIASPSPLWSPNASASGRSE